VTDHEPHVLRHIAHMRSTKRKRPGRNTTWPLGQNRPQ